MSPAQVWLAYAGLFFAGASFFAATAVEKVLERLSLAQLFYTLLLLGCACLAASRAIDAATLLGWLAVPAALFAWFSIAGEPEPDVSLRAIARKRLDAPLALLKERPGDPLALEAAGDAYREAGEPALALQYYKRCEGVDLREKVVKAQAQLDAPRASLFRACPACGTLVFRLQRRCDRCERDLYAGALDYAAVRLNRLFERYNLGPIAASAVLLLPFLYKLGALAYAALWGVWALALLSRRVGAAVGAGEAELGRALLRLAAVAAALGGIAAYARQTRVAQPSEPSPAPALAEPVGAASSAAIHISSDMEPVPIENPYRQ